MTEEPRELELICNNLSCKGEVIEEKREYKGEKLAVSVCPFCGSFDWILPSSAFDKNGDLKDEALEMTTKWAREESWMILKEHNLYYRINFSSQAMELLEGREIEAQRVEAILRTLCDVFETRSASAGKQGAGFRVDFGPPLRGFP